MEVLTSARNHGTSYVKFSGLLSGLDLGGCGRNEATWAGAGPMMKPIFNPDTGFGWVWVGFAWLRGQ